MAAPTRSVKVRFDGGTQGLQRASREAHKAVGGVGKAVQGLATAAAAAAAVAGGVAAGLAMLVPKVATLAANLELQARKASVVFEDQLPLVRAWAKANAKNMGLTSREVTGLAANFADLLKPMGFTAKQAAEMATKVIGLSGALAEWSGGIRTSSEVSDILAHAMLGERDALKGLGISISEEDIKARLAAKGQDKLTGARREQAEAIAAMELIFEKSKDAQTAFDTGGDTLARKISRWKAKFGEWRDDMVAKFTPAIKDAAEKLEKWVQDPEVQAWLRNVRDLLKTIAEKALPVIKEAWGDLVDAFKDNKEEIKLVAGIIGVVLVGSILAAIKFVGILVRTIGFIVDAAVWMVRGVLNVFDFLLQGAVKAFGWLPGIGPKLKDAATEFETFKNKVNASLDNLTDHTIKLTVDTGGIKPGRGGKTKKGGVTFYEPQQSGGWQWPGRTYLVGEQGPELVTPTRSGFVHTAAETANMLGGGPLVIENHIEIGGEVVRVVRTVISERDRGAKRRVLAGAGA